MEIQGKLKYSVPISNEKKQGETEIRRHPEMVGKQLLETFENKGSMQQIALESLKKNSKQMCLFSRSKKTNQYEGKTYEQVFQEAIQIASAILHLNLAPEINEYQNYKIRPVGVISKNREEWLIIDIGCCYLYGMTMAPFYDNSTPESINHCLKCTGVQNLFVSQQNIENLIKTQDLSTLKYVIALDQLTDIQIEKLRNKNLTVLTYQYLLEVGKMNPQNLPKINKNQVFTFNFTSGTTGFPKVAILLHQQFLSKLSLNHYSDELRVYQDDVHISYLPLPHIMERYISFCNISFGAKIYYYSGDISKIFQDIQEARPTIFNSVPRILLLLENQLKQKLKQGSAQEIEQTEIALKEKLSLLQKTGECKHQKWDQQIFQKTKNLLGGRVRRIGTGSAPIAGDTLQFLKVTLCCPIIEGYGLTESSAGCIYTSPKDPTAGHIGGPLFNVEFKLVDVPELNYFTDPVDQKGQKLAPKGELLLRGPPIFQGYYKDKQKTQEVLSEDNWFATGDVVELMDNGGLIIIDRKKNIFKLQQGEYVAPEKIENIYKQAEAVSEVFVYGNSLQSYLVGLIVPNQIYVEDLAKKLNLQNKNFQQLCKENQIQDAVLQNITKQGKKHGLYGFEQVKKIILEPVSLIIHGCLTSSFKLQRHLAVKIFKQTLEKLYEKPNL